MLSRWLKLVMGPGVYLVLGSSFGLKTLINSEVLGKPWVVLDRSGWGVDVVRQVIGRHAWRKRTIYHWRRNLDLDLGWELDCVSGPVDTYVFVYGRQHVSTD